MGCSPVVYNTHIHQDAARVRDGIPSSPSLTGNHNLKERQKPRNHRTLPEEVCGRDRQETVHLRGWLTSASGLNESCEPAVASQQLL